MPKKFKKILVISVAVVFIILGIAGLVLPFLQGVLFLFIGVILLSFYFPKPRLWIEKHSARYPHIFALTKKIEKWMAKIIGDI